MPSAVRLVPLALLAAALPLAAQTPASDRLSGADAAPEIRRQTAQAALSERDSIRALRRARSAQAGFERRRYREQPMSLGGGGGGRCDERIGRFCFWNDPKAEPWTPPPETEAVVRERERLLERLDSAAALIPGDGWVAAQRVRYRVEAGRTEDAVEAARSCRADEWWCDALAGYALHAAGDAEGAEAAFDAALAAMPAETREEWTDLEPILPSGEARRWRALPADQRATVERRFWWLADPLWSRPGNDRRAEHLARRVWDAMQDRARTTEGWSWGSDLREIVVRFGVPVGWQRHRPPHPALHGDRGVTVHYAPRGRTWVPALERAMDPWALTEEEGHPPEDPPPPVRTEYAPPYAAGLERLRPQVAVFRRGAGAIVVAGWEMEGDGVAADAPVEAALLLARTPDDEPAVARTRERGPGGVLRMDAAPGTWLLGVETLAGPADSARVGRMRRALRIDPAPAGLALSDLLLLRSADRLPETLEEAIPLARGGERVPSGEPVGLFWEVYGLDAPGAADTLSVSIRVERVGGTPWTRRLVERLGLAEPGRPVRVTWSEEPGSPPVLARSLAVGLPELRPGEYVLHLTVRPRGGPPATASRRLVVEP